jgi:hypothetical protein
MDISCGTFVRILLSDCCVRSVSVVVCVDLDRLTGYVYTWTTIAVFITRLVPFRAATCSWTLDGSFVGSCGAAFGWTVQPVGNNCCWLCDPIPRCGYGFGSWLRTPRCLHYGLRLPHTFPMYVGLHRTVRTVAGCGLVAHAGCSVPDGWFVGIASTFPVWTLGRFLAHTGFVAVGLVTHACVTRDTRFVGWTISSTHLVDGSSPYSYGWILFQTVGVSGPCRTLNAVAALPVTFAVYRTRTRVTFWRLGAASGLRFTTLCHSVRCCWDG